jgi:glycosyltransferase involved in cell wall biosynthesis
MVSPHPTYSPRGTPISVLNRCRALSALGHEVDLVTYGIGQDVPVPGLRYLRAPVPGIRSVKVGPSAAKLPLDLAVFARTAAILVRSRRRYDVLHTHEEAGVLGALARRPAGLPHVYDMGNDLSVVVTNYGYSRTHPATRLVAGIEAAVVARSNVVIAHFPSIADRVLEITGDAHRAFVVPNIALEPAPVPAVTQALRETWSPDGLPVALYTGTLEAYQGIPAMVDALAVLAERGVAARLVVVGGRLDQQLALRARADRHRLGDRLLIAGVLPPETIPSALAAADILVSPRATGSNTPLKLFSYLGSGRPILATAIDSHTQVLSQTCAALVPATAEDLAHGLAGLLADPVAATAMALRAKEVADARFGVVHYVREVARAYAGVGGPALSEREVQVAAERLKDQLAESAPQPPGHPLRLVSDRPGAA